MPNAKTATIADMGEPKFLLIGSTGSGKTAQILTLPGKTFCYIFDPSALSTLRGHDIEYEMFVPQELNLGAISLGKGKSDPTTITKSNVKVYNDWEKDLEAKLKDNFFEQFDNICFDSFTTFSDIVMDRILAINGRVGQFPQQDDWPAQMTTISNVVRTLMGLRKTLLFTAHDEIKQDEVTKRIQNVIILTGRLRVKLPLLFSDIWHMECTSTAETFKYQAQTRPDRMNPTVRCTFRDLDMFHDVTIENWENPENYGIGKILKEHSK